jgi:hypothetical protein
MAWRIVYDEIWRDPWFRKLTIDQKTAFLWCITNDAVRDCGVIETDWETVEFETGLSDPETVIRSLSPKVEVVYENGGRWLFVANFLERQRGRGGAVGNLNRRAAKTLRGLPLPVHAAVLEEYPELHEHIGDEGKELTAHQEMVQTLADVEGREELTKRDFSRLGRFAKELLDMDATPEEVRLRADRYLECKDWDLTAQALVNHWTAIPSWEPRGPRQTQTLGVGGQLMKMAAEERANGSDTGQGARGRPVRGLPGQ